MKKGVIVKWMDERGFGFVESEDLTGQLFVHIKGSDCRDETDEPVDTLRVGDRVSFEVITSERTGRPMAGSVRLEDDHAPLTHFLNDFPRVRANRARTFHYTALLDPSILTMAAQRHTP